MLEEMDVAIAWHLTPTMWYREPRWSRIVMVARCRLRAWIDYWVAEAAVEKN